MNGCPKDKSCYIALDSHIQKVYEYANEISIVISGLRDLEIENLAEELHTIKGQLIDTLWDMKAIINKKED